MEAVQIAAGMMLRGNLRDLHKRMLQEQPGQFAAGIACASLNCHAHRGAMFLLSAQQEDGSPVSVAIVGGTGYTGGELARLLLQHPFVQITQIASEHHPGSYLHSFHPNLRPSAGRLPIRMVAPDALEPCD